MENTPSFFNGGVLWKKGPHCSSIGLDLQIVTAKVAKDGINILLKIRNALLSVIWMGLRKLSETMGVSG